MKFLALVSCVVLAMIICLQATALADQGDLFARGRVLLRRSAFPGFKDDVRRSAFPGFKDDVRRSVFPGFRDEDI